MPLEVDAASPRRPTPALDGKQEIGIAPCRRDIASREPQTSAPAAAIVDEGAQMGKRTRKCQSQEQAAHCWYCRRTGVSAEHVFARSFSKLFSGHGTFRLDYEHPELGRRFPPRRASKLMIKSRKFCRSCNSGWMNRIDQDIRRVVQCFVLDARTSLDERDQRLLSLWTTKTVLGLLSIEPDEYRFAGRELYREVFETREPSRRSQIWVGANMGGDVAWARGHALSFRTPGENAAGFGFTLSFGYGVLHFIQHARDDLLLRLRYEPHQALRQIWPIAEPEVKWPPVVRFQPRDLSGLAIEIGSKSALRTRPPERTTQDQDASKADAASSTPRRPRTRLDAPPEANAQRA